MTLQDLFDLISGGENRIGQRAFQQGPLTSYSRARLGDPDSTELLKQLQQQRIINPLAATILPFLAHRQ